MTAYGQRPGEQAALEREAQAWLVRLTSGEATTADAAALKRWCGQSPAHAAAFAEVNLLWDTLNAAARNIASRSEAPMAAAPSGGVGRRLGRRTFLGATVAASAAAATAMVAYPPLHLWPSLPELAADYRTGTGEQRRITVADGASVELNTRTSLSIQSTEGHDGIELIAGEAAFVTGAAAGKPFVVIAADGRTIASSAQFNVRHDGPDVCVTCLDGEIRVEHRGHAATLEQRQQVVYGGRGLEQVVTTDPAVVTGWREGMLVFRNEPLARVIDEVNRYRPGKIVLMNAELGRRSVVASFRLDRIDDVITLVRDAYGAQVRLLPGGIVLLS